MPEYISVAIAISVVKLRFKHLSSRLLRMTYYYILMICDILLNGSKTEEEEEKETGPKLLPGE